MRCDEPEGSVVRHVRIPELTKEKLEHYWEKLKKFEVIFNGGVPSDFVEFSQWFIGQDASKTIRAKGIIYEVDDVGILWMTDLGMRSALVHFNFWDRRLRGRIDLLKEMVKYVFKEFGLERLEVRVGLHARPALYFVERVGFKKEGRLRNTVKYKGEWFDSNIYSIIREDLDNGSNDEGSK